MEQKDFQSLFSNTPIVSSYEAERYNYGGDVASMRSMITELELIEDHNLALSRPDFTTDDLLFRHSRGSSRSSSRSRQQGDPIGDLGSLQQPVQLWQGSPMEEEEDIYPPHQTNNKTILTPNKPPKTINLGYTTAQRPGQSQMEVDTVSRQRIDKIARLQQAGCNCKKSKCLKLYCECFNLQIFCGPNCNCCGCGNQAPGQGHHKAVLDALSRNPKAFNDFGPPIVSSSLFELGVDPGTVKKGCRCKKTKCLKKYCECYNLGQPCGMFCKCQGCENCAE